MAARARCAGGGVCARRAGARTNCECCATQQLDSAPTSDNEHDAATGAMLLRPAGDAATAKSDAALASMLLGTGDAALLDFPWAAADAGAGAWDGAGALLA